ncbi:MAG: L-threonylcarbamoyladenylate synthase [Actinomycetota bacterium]|nr:L-threonylcarbamoyladenylate synthase [Actinomycetota bacterium]MDK1017636.1 L-threonylcarbamoyladenylate synthase [Actinomycetota bacterium]MDK1027499.1 L-threonylcarbamoyladenylate synthase [Actinomycetota bacterium]MDK1039232.1 L-threonylcarbamoyladenylate synthase [Actinomycetota bacterium]MDK1097441.1 L-threonylcarbamoyladenylate synthase [Actinomycetota bacterium]
MDVEAAARAIKRGEIIGLPTDTVYGIAADLYDEAALERLYDLKGRDHAKPISILVASVEQGLSLGAMTDRAMDLAEQHWPGGMTLVVPRLDTAPEWLGDQKRRTVALRCPDHPVALELLDLTGPLVVTSVNGPDDEPVATAEEAEAVFEGDVLTYLPGRAGGAAPSTLVDLTQPSEVVLRPGLVRP